MKSPSRRVGLVLASAVALLAIAIPVLAASPSPSGAPGKSEKPGKAEKGPETPISLRGTVQQSSDADGHQTYTVSVDGKTWTLSAGPPWFWGDKNPLGAYVGKAVTIAGTTRAGDAEVDVETVNGKALREPGKPPWAGGPWVVGPTHPGWRTGWPTASPARATARSTRPVRSRRRRRRPEGVHGRAQWPAPTAATAAGS